MPKRGVRQFNSFIELIAIPFKWIGMQFKRLWERLKPQSENNQPSVNQNSLISTPVSPFSPLSKNNLFLENKYGLLKQKLIDLKVDMLKKDALIYQMFLVSRSTFVYQADAQTLSVYNRASQIAKISAQLKQAELQAQSEEYEEACSLIEAFLLFEWMIKYDFKPQKEASLQVAGEPNLSEKDYRYLIDKLEKEIQDKKYRLPAYIEMETALNLQDRIEEADAFLNQAKSFLELNQKIVDAKNLVTEIIYQLKSADWAYTVALNPNNRALLLQNKIIFIPKIEQEKGVQLNIKEGNLTPKEEYNSLLKSLQDFRAENEANYHSISLLILEYPFNTEYAKKIDEYRMLESQLEVQLDSENVILNENDEAYKEGSEQIRAFLKRVQLTVVSKSVPPASR